MEIKEIVSKHNQDFRYLSEADLEEISQASFIRSYKKGQVLFHPGDHRTHLYLLKTGVIRIEKSDSSGDFFYLHFVKAGCLFPRIGLFQDGAHSDSAIAHTDIEIVVIPVKVFEKNIRENPQQLMKWIQIQSDLLKLFMTRMQKGMTNNACQRVMTTLAILFNDLGAPLNARGQVIIPCPMKINDIAKMSGTTRETTSSIIKKLVKMNKISYNHKQLTFLDTAFFIQRLEN
ncbi:Crp/Fnr family transcriptional regulator [Enterococcus faecalis]